MSSPTLGIRVGDKESSPSHGGSALPAMQRRKCDLCLGSGSGRVERALDQPQLLATLYGFEATVSIQFAIEPLGVRSDGADSNVQFVGDFLG